MNYSVWFVPTDEGARAFKWTRKKISGGFDDEEEACYVAYLEDCDDPAPDKHNYRKIIVEQDKE